MQIYSRTDRQPHKVRETAKQKALSYNHEFVPPSNSSYLSRNIFPQNGNESVCQLFGGMIRSGIISNQLSRTLLKKKKLGGRSSAHLQ